MISAGNTIYLDVGKTGSSYVSRRLFEMFGGDVYNTATRHKQLPEYPDLNNTLVYTTVRNPYSWYGSMYEYNKHHPKNVNSTNPITYEDSIVKQLPYTWYYIRYLDWNFYQNLIAQPLSYSDADIENWFNRTWFSGNENLVMIGAYDLKADFVDLLESRKEMFPSISNFQQHLDILRTRKTCIMYDNVNNFDREPLSQNMIDIITEKDRILIDHFGFTLDNVNEKYLLDV